ncbi:Apoptotic ATPase [Handroanthus impetiginosus]|uniref:Apoptotic ATPase n=1 Tax=Handroanthus impetiginosus TaxID=429701 RepID=A0A2G9HUD8_9LAMI|nr:Apoptotic ATPase [Handroanthus impetiginosus]
MERLVVLESRPLEISKEFESRRLIEENIIGALKDENIHTIGICGVGGIGKTRMATRIGEKVKEEKLFDFVVMVRLGPNPDLKRIVYEISDYFGVRLQRGDFVATKDELLSRLNMEDRILIILDDIREILDIKKIGIPLQKHKGSCKIVITSRYKSFCLAMGVQEIFVVQGFTKEPSREEVGSSTESSSLYPPARSVSEYFKWLPFRHKVLGADINVKQEEGSSQILLHKLNTLPPRRGRVKARVFESLSASLDGILRNLVFGSSPDKRSIYSRPAWSSPASGGKSGTNLHYHMDRKRFHSPPMPLPTIEEVRVDSPERYRLEGGEEIHDDDVPPADYPESSGLEQGEERHEEDVCPHSFSEGHKDQICHEAELEVSMDMVLHENRYLKDCILFCSGFPSDYGFTRDMLVWQWIAEGLIKLEKDEKIEEECIHYFDTLLKLDYIVPCGYDHCFDNTIYDVGDKMKAFPQEQLLKPKFRSYSDINESDAGKIEHLSLDSKEIDHIDFGILKQCSSLQTLIIHRCYGMQVKHLPCDLFLKLKDLKILNLSHTNIEELPSSVVNLRELRYLDMSETPISWLPESIHCLGNLQTLKLDGCLSLTELPKCTSELINLQHLVLDVVQLQSMPKGIGKLLKLRTLRAFLIGEEDGNRIGELENMNKLKGSFDLLNLEYVMSKDEAAEARLCNKRDLKKIDLHWSDLQDEKNPNEEEILESLQPPIGIQELTIIFYSGGMLPSWISNPSFSEIVSVILYKCRYVGSLPSLGELPSLKLLKIVENHEVKEINNSFCRKQTDQHRVAFPKLEKLSFGSMYKLEKWTEIENGDFPSLHSLIIEYCPKLAALPFLSHLNSLSHMEIRSCQELSCFPEGGLPATLGCLMITDCPGLKSRCCDEQCEDWSKVAHVPDLYIDCQKVSVQP